MDTRYAESNRIYEEAKMIMPGGVTKARVPHIPGRYPIYMSRAFGSRVWDIDGNEYIDWMSGYGSILLGHGCREVNQAVIKQMENGGISILSHPIQNELARRLIDTVPCAEMVRFFKTGTDATSAAVRIARIYTGRNLVARLGYHGWNDWSLQGFKGFDGGVPQAVLDMTMSFKHNDIDSLRKLFSDHPGEIACVIMMPLETDEPSPGFLEDVKETCQKNGAVLIFDEIRSGFRMAPGGAQEYYNVVPDLAAIGKGMANGYAISAVVGRRDVMESVAKGLFSATFFVSPLEMAAAMATMDIMREENVIARLWETGRSLQDGLRRIVDNSSVSVRVIGVPPMPFLEFASGDQIVDDRVREAFFTETAANGVYFHPKHHWFVNFSHSVDDLKRTLEVCEQAMKSAEKVCSPNESPRIPVGVES